MNSIYISGPYTALNDRCIDENIRLARIEAIRWWKQGFGVFCPHMNTAYFDYESIPYDSFLEYDLQQVRQHDAILMLTRWEDSKGSIKELEMAKQTDRILVFQRPLVRYDVYLSNHGYAVVSRNMEIDKAAAFIKENLQ